MTVVAPAAADAVTSGHAALPGAFNPRKETCPANAGDILAATAAACVASGLARSFGPRNTLPVTACLTGSVIPEGAGSVKSQFPVW